MAQLSIAGVTKRFGDLQVLSDINLDVRDGEFIAVLGPSGCGKTTLLRLVAGFEKAQSGTISFGDRTVSSPQVHVPPENRNIGIVFQSYALWPHMNVAENVGYGLKVARIAPAERDRRIKDALALVGLADMGERPPAMLSGGQRQRVALARCLVTVPSLVLLDEPLANLDVHLRASMEDEFADFHKRTGTTMFYITHDQAEAMALADRIAVMDRGVLMQLATPKELYREPATEMVAEFIGQGLVVGAEIVADADGPYCLARFLGTDVRVRCAPGQRSTQNARLCLRPRELRMAVTGELGIDCRVTRAIYQGGYFRIEAKPDCAPDLTFILHQNDHEPVEVGQAISIAIADGWVIPDKKIADARVHSRAAAA